MKLVYCIPSLDSAGGTERVLTNKVNYLAEHYGWEIHIVLTERQKGAPYFPLHPSVRVVELDLDFRADYGCGILGKSVAYVRKIRTYRRELEKLLMHLRPDITTSLLSHEIDFLHKLRDGSKKIGENHFYKDFRLGFIAMGRRSSLLRRCVARLRNRQLIACVRRLDELVVLTEDDARAWHEVRYKTVIPNALTCFPERVSDGGAKRVVAAGRYVPQKGYDLLLRTWEKVRREFPDWELVIYGDGEARPELERYAATHGLDDVRLEHAVNDVFDRFAESSLSVLSSRFEGFGLVVIEAMACGLPVVAFDCKCGPGEIIRNGEDGLLVPAGDCEALAEGMERLMRDEGLRRRMGRAARSNVERYRMERVMKQWVALYERLLV